MLGKKFGRLTVVDRTSKKIGNNPVYLCQCECGNTHEVTSSHFNTTKSCGCLKKEVLRMDAVEGTRLRNLTMQKVKRKVRDSGVKGVIWDTPANKWRAQIGIKGKRINLGRYAKLEDAIAARKKAEALYHLPILNKYR